MLETDPEFPSTQPLAIPGDLSDGARLVVKEHLHLDANRDLWITHPNADATPAVLQRAGSEQLHLTRELVRFVHYWTDSNNRNQLAVIAESSPGNFEWITETSRWPIELSDPPDFQRAASWDGKVIVPGKHGVSILTPRKEIAVTYQRLRETPGLTLFAFDPQGVLAWAPPERGQAGSDGAYRFAGEAWTTLDASRNWPSKILHLIPLLDGSVLVLREDKDGTAGVTLMTLDGAQSQSTSRPVEINEARLTELVAKLSDREPAIREQAFAELARYGPGAFAIFEKLKPDQPFAAKLRLDELLRARLEQSLGTLRLEAGKLEAISRFDDGGAVYYAEAGVTIFSENVGPQLYAPAYISVRPGRAVRLLPEFLVRDFAHPAQKLIAFADEWFITDELQGPRRFIGNHFQKILRKREREYWQLVGIDRRGRWLLTNSDRSSTLVLDPTLPDPSPKLPVWEYPVRKGEIGWTKDNWAAVKKGGAWVLTEKAWRPMDEEKEPFFTDVPGADNGTSFSPTTSPATQSSALPTTATTQPNTPPILVEKDGTKWFDGADHLIKVSPAGEMIDWELPGVAVGGGSVKLFRVDDRRYLLFNQTARIVSIRETPGGREPFQVEAIFTDRIPDTDTARRIWQDPAGRILIAIDDNLWILFPTGKVPEQLENMMPAGSLSREE